MHSSSRQLKRGRTRVLFVGEAVTLAHALRPWALASSLDPSRYDVHFAVDPEHIGGVLGKRAGVTTHPIRTIEPRLFRDRLAQGVPAYRLEELEEYLAADLRLIDELQPDVLVGDFRVTLSVASQLRDIPLLALMHAHWSASSTARVPTPDLPMERLVGARLLGWGVRALVPLLFRLHCRDFNQLRVRKGLPPVATVRQMYTEATRTLFLDLPELSPTTTLPSYQRFIGPMSVEPSVPLPSWAEEVPTDRPVVYVSSGSSGNPYVMQRVISSLAVDATVLVADVGRFEVPKIPHRVFSAKFLPGNWACERSDVVVCNGGAGSVYQALKAGKPVLSLPTNMDQWFVAEALEDKGAGLSIRTRHVCSDRVSEAIARLLHEPSFRKRALELGKRMKTYDPFGALQREIDHLVGPCCLDDMRSVA